MGQSSAASQDLLLGC